MHTQDVRINGRNREHKNHSNATPAAWGCNICLIEMENVIHFSTNRVKPLNRFRESAVSLGNQISPTVACGWRCGQTSVRFSLCDTTSSTMPQMLSTWMSLLPSSDTSSQINLVLCRHTFAPNINGIERICVKAAHTENQNCKTKIKNYFRNFSSWVAPNCDSKASSSSWGRVIRTGSC